MYRYIEGHGVISNSYTVKCYLLKIKFTIQYNTILQMNKTQRDMCLRELIITLLREVKDILSRENSVSTAVSCG